VRATLRQLENRAVGAVRDPLERSVLTKATVPWSVQLLDGHHSCLLASWRRDATESSFLSGSPGSGPMSS
jgi:hypothetical protein